ncbi:MAG: DUF1501 domain-containing protein [Terriglobales bacterium]
MSSFEDDTVSRRQFLLYGTSIVAAHFVGFCAPGQCAGQFGQEAARERRAIVMLHLRGGNDSLNMTVPYNANWYYDARPNIAVPRASVLPLDDQIGLPQEMSALHQLFKRGEVAIYPATGHGNMSKSHVRAAEMWNISYDDWVRGDAVRATDSHRPIEFLCDDPSTLAHAFESTCEFLRHGTGSIHITLDGFDTHDNQYDRHMALLQAVSQALDSFQTQLRREGMDKNVVTFVYSEFGRRAFENDELGTTHGEAGAVLVVGTSIKGGVYDGTLLMKPNGDLTVQTEFRDVLAKLPLRPCQRIQSIV